jgi:hypothetical protein
MYSVLNCHNLAKHTELYVGQVEFNVSSTGNAERFKRELYNDIPYITVWRVLRKRLPSVSQLSRKCGILNV